MASHARRWVIGAMCRWRLRGESDPGDVVHSGCALWYAGHGLGGAVEGRLPSPPLG